MEFTPISSGTHNLQSFNNFAAPIRYLLLKIRLGHFRIRYCMIGIMLMLVGARPPGRWLPFSSHSLRHLIATDILFFSAIAISNDEEFHRNPFPIASAPTSSAVAPASLRRTGSGAHVTGSGTHVTGSGAHVTASASHVTFAGQVTSHYVDQALTVSAVGEKTASIKSRKTGALAHHGPSYRGFSSVSSVPPPPLPPKSSKTEKKPQPPSSSHLQTQAGIFHNRADYKWIVIRVGTWPSYTLPPLSLPRPFG
jgi:hypothetical protein